MSMTEDKPILSMRTIMAIIGVGFLILTSYLFYVHSISQGFFSSITLLFGIIAPIITYILNRKEKKQN